MSAVFVCEICTYPSYVAACDNPACTGNPTLSEAHKAKLLASAAKYAAERKEQEARLARKKSLRKQGFTTAF